MGNGIKILVQEYLLDQDYTHFVLLVLVPPLFSISLVSPLGYHISLSTNTILWQFFSLQFIQNLTMLLGPIAHYYENSRYYSALPPNPNKELDAALPHITIQMPVYKEGLDAVLWVSPTLSDRDLPNNQNQGSIDRVTQTCHANLRPTRRNVFYIRQ